MEYTLLLLKTKSTDRLFTNIAGESREKTLASAQEVLREEIESAATSLYPPSLSLNFPALEGGSP